MRLLKGALLLAAAGSAPWVQAGFPGVNGALVFERRTPRAGGHGTELYAITPEQPPAARHERRLTHSRLPGGQLPGTCSWPAWSPDGTRIACASNVHPALDGRRTREIYTMFADGHDQQRRTVTWAAPGIPASAGVPAWSPNGTRLAYISYLAGGPSEANELHVVDLAGNRLLTWDLALSRIAWSPDGSRIAFARSGQLWVITLATGQATPLTEAEAGTQWPVRQDPAWSPDGSRLVFAQQTTPEQPAKLWWMHADGTQPEQVTQGDGEDRHPEWSPDGLKLAYARGGAGHWEIHVRRAIADGSPDPRGPEDERLTHAPAGCTSDYPTWQPLPAPRDKVAKRGREDAPAAAPGGPAKQPRSEPPSGSPLAAESSAPPASTGPR